MEEINTILHVITDSRIARAENVIRVGKYI